MKARKVNKLNESFASEEGRKIQQIVNILGYDDFDHFLEDNPGCMEAVLDWIDNSFTDQLSNELSKEELESLGLYNSADEA